MSDATSGILLPFPHTDTLVATRPAMRRAQFEAIINQLHQHLRDRACTRAALWFDDTALFSCALLGCWAAGVQVLLAPDVLGDTRSWVQADADLWITDNALPDPAIPVLRLDTLARSLSCPQQRDMQASTETSGLFQTRPEGLFLPLPADAVAFLRTSGSSGAPRIIRKYFRQLHAEALTLIRTWSLHALPATLIASVSHQHMYGLTFRVMVPLHAGLVLDRMPSRYPESLAEQTQMYEQCIWITSPALLQRLPDSLPWSTLQPRLARVVSAGGVLAEATREHLLQRQWPLHEIYGSTETGVIATRHEQATWIALPGVSLETDSEHRLAVCSPWTDGTEQTADVISHQDANSFILLGRADRILKLEDKRISLSRVEQAALSHPYVNDIHCAPSPLGGRLCAMVELSAEGIAAFRQHGRRHVVRAISALLREAVDPLAVPRHWRFPLTLPRNAQSKITRQHVQDCFTQTVRAPQWEQGASDTAANPSTRPSAAPSETPATPHTSSEPPSASSTQTPPADSSAPPLQTASGTECCLSARVPMDLVYFQGHFPSFPLVPGVVQLGWALEQARARKLCSGTTERIENLKFQHFLRPADPCTMTLKWDDSKRKLYFTVRTGTTMTASGRIAFVDSA
ncbi:AMP-binding protein [Advenella mimigardefordensis]|uniref:AMP-dependent ligase n=1 Tax=Advenella mimigardefordensis (strain DSM 17166 / LMG 22922 / DPN7) TaxID=1247726 RepID=W0PKK5_ADVMD|nr:AMP-binding protein [Advenella mimigardefordensis]AHG66090.1 AMP-dependent ligase [Advenella mimigardefordensis DPN7]